MIGGYAVAFHGHPRYTKDLDIWVDRNEENAVRLIRALGDFGFASVGLTVSDFLEPGQVVQLGQPPLRVDLITSLEGLDFASCYPSRISKALDGTMVDFIDVENLKVAKRSAGRAQDLADLENLQ